MNYFNELQERLRQIRLSESFFYQKVKDIYATSIDYDPKYEKTIEFFKIVQNKLLWAISKQTAAEVIYRMWEIIISSFEHTLDIIEATINNIEDNILTELYPSQLDRFFQLSRDAVFMEAALRSNMKVLRRLKRTQRIGKMVLDTDRLEELEVDLQQQMELSAIYRELIDNAMNAYDSIVGHNLNQVMKVLTSVSLLVSVPTLIASLLGMNVDIPFSRDDPLAFSLIIILSVLVSLPILIYLRHKNLV